MSKQESIGWLKHQYKGELSKLGGNAAWFIDKIWGLHHINRTSISKVDWSNEHWIEIVIDRPLCTVDSNDLTRMVVISHQMMLRLELEGAAPGYIRMIIHGRTSRNREDGFSNWCPEIHEHVNAIMEYHLDIDQPIEPT